MIVRHTRTHTPHTRSPTTRTVTHPLILTSTHTHTPTQVVYEGPGVMDATWSSCVSEADTLVFVHEGRGVCVCVCVRSCWVRVYADLKATLC